MIYMGAPRIRASECDCCHNPMPASLGAFCGGDHCKTAERDFDRWMDRHDDIAGDD